jgi:hypothetical protein
MYAWTIRSQFDPIKQVAGLLKIRLVRILTSFVAYVSNGALQDSTAGFNRPNSRREVPGSLNTTGFGFCFTAEKSA